MFTTCLCHSRKTRLGGKIGAHMVSHQDGGAFVDDIERFDHMLLFAMWIRRNARSIFEVERPGLASARSARSDRYRWGDERQCVRFRTRAGE